MSVLLLVRGGWWWSKKSLRFGLVQILGLVTHWCEALGAQTGPTSSLSAGPGHRARASLGPAATFGPSKTQLQSTKVFEIRKHKKKSAQVGRHVEASPQWQEEWRKNPQALARTTLLQIV